jgi:hypothetical protein
MSHATFSWKFLLTGLTIALAGLPLILRGQTKSESDQQAIVAVIDRFVEAWNRHDAKAFAAVFAEDADFPIGGAKARADERRLKPSTRRCLPRFLRTVA